MNNLGEIQEIVEKLKQLQLQQAVLLYRLDQLSEESVDRGSSDSSPRTQSGIRPRPRGVIVAARKFKIGDSVQILNPGPRQATKGVISKIGTSRITIEDKDGNKLIRTSKNLKIEE